MTHYVSVFRLAIRGVQSVHGLRETNAKDDEQLWFNINFRSHPNKKQTDHTP
jgi:hypothetical protein